MGWLQGSRFRNIPEIRQSRAKDSATEGNHVSDHEALGRATIVGASIKKAANGLSGNGTTSPGTSSDLGGQSEIDVLLEATFGCKNVPQPSTSNKQVGITGTVWPRRLFQDEDVPDHALPFIGKDEIKSKCLGISQKSEFSDWGEVSWAWIVVDEIVYDCSDFIDDHPGGKEVIFNFIGQDCSWQFWTFHSRDEMEQYGRSLRIGRTTDVPNNFEKRPKYVGLGRIGHDEW